MLILLLSISKKKKRYAGSGQRSKRGNLHEIDRLSPATYWAAAQHPAIATRDKATSCHSRTQGVADSTASLPVPLSVCPLTSLSFWPASHGLLQDHLRPALTARLGTVLYENFPGANTSSSTRRENPLDASLFLSRRSGGQGCPLRGIGCCASFFFCEGATVFRFPSDTRKLEVPCNCWVESLDLKLTSSEIHRQPRFEKIRSYGASKRTPPCRPERSVYSSPQEGCSTYIVPITRCILNIKHHDKSMP